jgi:acetyl esterase/lipase
MITLRDQSYDPSIPERLVDAYFPDGTPNAAMMWYHGGGLETGDRRVGDDFAQFVTDQGCALVSVEYRMSPQVRHPLWLEDGAAAVRWTQDQLVQRNAGSVPIFLSGHSAGGWVALMLGMDTRYLQDAGVDPQRIAGILPISGQTTTHHRIRLDNGQGHQQPIVDAAAPLFHVSATTPPVIAFTGDGDMAMRSTENQFLIEALAAHGHTDHAFHEIPGRDHCSIASGLANPDDVVCQRMWAFINRLRQSHPRSIGAAKG